MGLSCAGLLLHCVVAEPLAQKAQKILSAKGAKENFHKAPKAPKLLCTVILWYSFVVQPPPPPCGETVTS